MVAVQIGGVRFKVYPQDHTPYHVHGLYAGIEVIVVLRPGGQVALARRRDAVKGNAKRSDVRTILDTAAGYDAFMAAWKEMHP